MAWSVSVSCRLDCTVEQARAILMDPSTLQHVAAPILRFRPIDPPHWPAPWQEGDYLASVRLFGILPLGHQWIRTSFPPLPDDDGTGGFAVRDNGSGWLARSGITGCSHGRRQGGAPAIPTGSMSKRGC